MEKKKLLFNTPRPVLLIDFLKELLNFTFENSTPLSPIMEVNGKYLKVELDRLVIRNWGLPIAFITFLVLGYTYTKSVHESWKNRELATIKFIERRKILYGDNYFEATDNKVALQMHSDIGEDQVLSFQEYLINYRYNPNRIGGSQLGFDIFRISFILLGLFLSLYYFIRFKRLAPLIFDRERRLFYTWRSGKVMVQRYSDMQFLGNLQGLFIPLGAIPTRKKWGGKPLTGDSVGWFPFRIMPEGNIYVNDVNEYEGILAYIAQFMEYGRDHVMPNAESWTKTKKDYLLYEDKQPDDLEEQMVEILRRLEINRPQWLDDIKDQ